MMDYEEYVTEQESRTFFGKPVRQTTLMCYPDKMNYQGFIDFLEGFSLQRNLRHGERFIEEWVELFLAYHEIEQSDESDIKHNAQTIDNNFDGKGFGRIF